MNANDTMVKIGSFVTNSNHGPITTTLYMGAKEFDKNEIKKDLYKSKNMAKFSHYISGNMYYTVQLQDGIYKFPIPTVEENEVHFEITANSTGLWETLGKGVRKEIVLSKDLGETTFGAEIKGSELNRWIAKAIDKEEFIKIG